MDREEWANTLTHGLGAAASVGVGALLIVAASLRGDPWLIVGSAVFAAAMVVLYTTSTLYHAARAPTLKKRLQVADHAAIFILIAGTYTPFTLVGLRGGWGWTLFGLVWGLATLGIVLKLFFTGRFRVLSTSAYIALGWMGLVALGPMVSRLPAATLGWLLAGGAAYTAGTLFYHRERWPYAHAVWHVFVLAGTLCHAAAVWSMGSLLVS